MSKMFVFPNTVRKIQDDAFRYAHLESVVLNEGIERLGDLQDEDGCYHEGPFHCSWIRQIVLPSMLKVLGNQTFRGCEHLSRVAFRQVARTKGGNDGLQELRRGEAVLPASLERVGRMLFEDCQQIKVI